MNALRIIGLFLVVLLGLAFVAVHVLYTASVNFNNIGLRAYNEGNLDMALDRLNLTLRLNPFLAVAYNNRGLVEYKKKEIATAIADYTTSLSLDPRQSKAYDNRGLAREASGDNTGARADFDKALELLPNSATALGNRGELRDRIGDFDGAIADFNQALSLEQDKPDLFNNRGLAEYHKKEFVTAIADYTMAISLNDLDAIYYSNRGLAEKEQGNLGGALADLNKALQLSPDDPITLNNRGLIEAKQHHFDAAIADYNATIKGDPKNSIAYNNRAMAEMEKYDWDGALADTNASYTLEPTAVTRVLRGWIKFLKGDVAGAIADYTDSIKQKPDAAGVYEERGLAYYASGQPAAAAADFQKGLDLKIRYTASSHFYLFVIRMESPDEKAAAISDLNAYLAGEGLRLHGWAGQVGRFLSGKMAEADFIAASQDPDAAKSRNQLCEAYFFSAIMRDLAGDKAGAADLYQKCVGTGAQNLSEYEIARTRLVTGR